MNNDKQKLLEMASGEVGYYNWFDGGGAEIWRTNDIFHLFEVPQYGGEPRYYDSFYKTEIEAMIKLYESWS